MTDRNLGIYVHIPFCIQKCKYCDFCSFSKKDDSIKRKYADTLVKNIEAYSAYFADRCVDSIFFGGGTPTCLKTDDLCRILKCINSQYNVSNDAEITIECNPATADRKDFSALKKSGFNRLSLGLQSVHDNELSALGRIHSFEQFKQTFFDARLAGIENINVDLMYGIPFQTKNSFEETLKTLIEISPEHISAYALKIEPGTYFFENIKSLSLPDEDEEYEMYKLADQMLSAAGYEHYEISNYAKNAKRSRHNVKYWSLDDYIGFGVAAHSLINGARYSVGNSINDYISSPISYYDVEEQLKENDIIEEYIMMRLRLKDGFSTEEFRKRFSSAIEEKYIERMKPFIKSGHIIVSNGSYSLSTDGMYVSNYILSEILDLGT